MENGDAKFAVLVDVRVVEGPIELELYACVSVALRVQDVCIYLGESTGTSLETSSEP